MSVAQREWVRRGQREALHAWWQAGHPGWRLWDGMDGDAFLRGVQAQVRAAQHHEKPYQSCIKQAPRAGACGTAWTETPSCAPCRRRCAPPKITQK